jgi:hypothetical protein
VVKHSGLKKTAKKSKPKKEAVKPSILDAEIQFRKRDWRPLFMWLIAVITIGAFMFFAFEYIFPAPETNGDELIGTYGPYDLYKADEHDYYMQINPELIWHFRANPLDTISIPVFPFKENFKEALEGADEVWITFAAEEDPRIVLAAVEISKTLGAQGYTVKRGWVRQPKICETDFENIICDEPIIPPEFANENRTVFKILGPLDNISTPAIYVIGNNIVVQAPDYDQLDLVADKAVLIMLNLA